ncbi:ATP phosphoribosyltransferase [Caldicoprobacter guelmensis]|uniref:ATP phosphoribosyltransferase n=1 Tax=Caldicoprobacter guelmensis TaxID=1170224 RepID=UPI0019575DEF
MSLITIALAKGRLMEEAVDVLEAAGVDCGELKEPSRKLIFFTPDQQIRMILVKPSDVPTYVEYGIADMGIVGKDTLLEEGRSLYEMLDLRFGQCRLVVAGFPEKQDMWITRSHTRVATKYPNIARNYFARKGKNVEIIKLNGSVELGPLTGLSDVIVDIVESGRTLKENGLVILEEICSISARLVVNRVSLKTKHTEIKPLIDNIQMVVEELQNDKIN